MDASPLVALERLRRTRRRDLAKAAVKELVRSDVLRMHSYTPKRGRRRSPRPAVVDGPSPLPAGTLLLLVARTVQSTPSENADGRVVRDLHLVARRLARLRNRLTDAALQDLLKAGLVEQRAPRLPGRLGRPAWRRTAAGDEALRNGGRRRDREEGDPGLVVFPGSGGDDRPEPPRGWEGEVDRVFDASFDSGWSAGDGAGGDGGGGGGGGD